MDLFSTDTVVLQAWHLLTLVLVPLAGAVIAWRSITGPVRAERADIKERMLKVEMQLDAHATSDRNEFGKLNDELGRIQANLKSLNSKVDQVIGKLSGVHTS